MHVRSWKFHSVRLFLCAMLVLLAGWAIGYLGLTFFGALAAYILWHAVNLWRLSHWLNHASGGIPESYGIWADIFDGINSLEHKNKRQKKRYRTMFKEFRSLTDSFPDALLILNEKNAITWFNKSARSVLRLRSPRDLGQPVTSLLRGPEFANWLTDAHKTGSSLDVQSPRNEYTRLQINAITFRKKQRLLILRDITNVQNVERIRRDFVANMSHELRTPLTVLLGYLELLQQQPPGQMSEAIERMQTQGKQMQDMLNDLLELSRLQSDEIPSEEAFVDVPAMLIRLRKQTEELSQGKHKLLLNVEGGPSLSGSASDLESAFYNLLINAVRYTPENGTITVNWHDSQEGPRLSVRDTGIGIPKRDIPRLTERFYRVGSDRARQSGGTGLGLAIVKHILNAHQARLLIESELNAGSEFICIFPPERKRTGTAPVAG